MQCKFDLTYQGDPRYCWVRTGNALLAGTQFTRPPTVVGASTPTGSLNYFPSSSTSLDSGVTLTINASSCPVGVQLEASSAGTKAIESTQTFNWGMGHSDAITCPAGSSISGAATSTNNSCNTAFEKAIVTGPPLNQTPGPCSVGNPCFPGNGNKQAEEAGFEYGRIRLDFFYNSLRQTRPYAYIDRNWSHSLAKRL